MESVDQYLRRAAEKVAEKSSDPYIRRFYVDIAEHWRDIASAAREIGARPLEMVVREISNLVVIFDNTYLQIYCRLGHHRITAPQASDH
jgi:hypothetical protein